MLALDFNVQDGENQSRGSSTKSSLNRCGPCPSNCIPAPWQTSGHERRPDTRPIEAPSRDKSSKNQLAKRAASTHAPGFPEGSTSKNDEPQREKQRPSTPRHAGTQSGHLVGSAEVFRTRSLFSSVDRCRGLPIGKQATWPPASIAPCNQETFETSAGRLFER